MVSKSLKAVNTTKAQKVPRKGVQIVSVKSKFVVPNTVIDWIRASSSAQPLIHVDATFY